MNFLVNDAPRTSDVQPEVQTPQMICKNCKFCNKYWNDSKKCFAKMKDKYSADKKCGTLHDFACHPCAGAMLIFSVSFQF